MPNPILYVMSFLNSKSKPTKKQRRQLKIQEQAREMLAAHAVGKLPSYSVAHLKDAVAGKKAPATFESLYHELKTQNNNHKKSEKHKSVSSENRGELVKTLLTRTSFLLKQKKDLQAASDEFDRKYVSVDVKGLTGTNPITDKLKLNALELSEVAAIAKSAFGNKPVKVRLVTVNSANNTSSGVNQTVLSLDPAFSTEYASCAALWEQMRCRRLRVHHESCSVKQQLSAGSNTTALQGIGYYAIDTVSNTALTTPADALDSKTHMFYYTGLESSTGSVYRQCGGGTLEYHPDPDFVPNGGSGAMVLGGWCATIGSAGTVCLIGYGKFYEVNQFTATTSQTGIIHYFYDCEFRNRD